MADHAMILLKRGNRRQLMMTNERVVVDRPMIILRRSIGAIGITPVEISAAAIDETTVRITFSVPVIDNAALRNPANYSFSPVLIPLAVVVVSPTAVDVTVSEQLDGQSYTPTVIQTLEPA